MNEPQIAVYNIKETILKFLNDDIGWQCEDGTVRCEEKNK